MIISVNPFKNMPYFTSKEVDLYQGAVGCGLLIRSFAVVVIVT